MGFPNVDLLLVKIFIAGFAKAQAERAVIDDLFDDLSDSERDEIIEYLAATTVTGDVRQRKEGHRHLYVLPHFPLSNIAFPQIGVSLGQEDPSARVLGDYTGDPVAVTDDEDAVLGYDQEQGYLAQGNWNIDVVCATKKESIWISRLCQLFICITQDLLEEKGVKEISVSLSDLKLEQQQTMQPSEIFNRGLRVSAKVANTWTKRLPPMGNYQTGVNKAFS